MYYILSVLTFVVPPLFAGLFALALWQSLRQYQRAEFIRGFVWPAGLLDKLALEHKGFTRKETALERFPD